jgi:triosephosphate isomerase
MLIAGNWKMYKRSAETAGFRLDDFARAVTDEAAHPEPAATSAQAVISVALASAQTPASAEPTSRAAISKTKTSTK